MISAHTFKLGIILQKIDVGFKKIIHLLLKIFDIVIATFQVLD